MKKIICLCISLCTLIVITGCSKKTGAVNLGGLYTMHASVELNGFSSEADINRLGNGQWEISFTKPESLNGLGVSYQNENADITYMGLKFQIPREDVPVQAIATNLTSVLEKLAYSKDIKYTENNGKVTAKGEVDNSRFVAVFEKKSNRLLSLEMEDVKLKADFSDFKPMN